MTAPMKIDALMFDVFGTVVDWRRSVGRHVESVLAGHAITADGNRIALAWRSGYQPAMNRVRNGERPFVPLDVLHRENLDRVLETVGLAELDDDLRDHLNLAWHRLDPWPDVLPGLERLRRRFLVAPCSNGNVRMMIDIARHAGLRWDTIVGAEPAQAFKPTARTYLFSAEMLGVPPERCMMVAAHNADLAAARDLGFRTGFVARPTEYGPDQTLDLTASGPWDVVTDGFEGLAEALDA